MELHAITYIVFLCLLLSLSLILPQKIKLPVLLGSSFLFIASQNLESLILAFLLSALTFFFAKQSCKISNKNYKAWFIYSAIIINVIFLLTFKYIKWNTHDYLFDLSSSGFQSTQTLLFVGLSFYVLSNIAFLMETLHGNIRNTISWSEYCFYTCFFAKFTSGPVILPQDFFAQEVIKKVTQGDIKIGVQRIALGIFKKVVLADSIAPRVHYYFDIAMPENGFTALSIVYFFTIQLYLDFSAYSDIAIGSARLFGISFSENFSFPLKAISVTDFWRKWHISLSTWLSRYIYYPIAFRYRERKKIGILLAIVVTFLLSGIWHGWGLTFIIYALCHAFYLCVEYLSKEVGLKLKSYLNHNIRLFLGICYTFNLVSLSFVFFRSSTMTVALNYFELIFNSTKFLPENIINDYIALLALGGDLESIFNFFASAILIMMYFLLEKNIYRAIFSGKNNFYMMGVLVILIFLFGIFKSKEQFIYLQF
jgi:alginate O-acetyltransferase complex protein AlgI